MRWTPHAAHGGRGASGRTRSAPRRRTSTSAASSPSRSRLTDAPSRRRTRPASSAPTRWAGQAHRRARAPRGGGLHLRRGDGPHELPRGQARQPAHQAAVPRRGRPLRAADDDQQRRDAVGRPAHPERAAPSGTRRCQHGNPKSTGTKLFSVCGNVSRPGNYEMVMGFPFGEFLDDSAAGRRGPHVQGGDPGRLVGADAHARRGRGRGHGLRGHRRGRHHAGLGRRDRVRRRAVDAAQIARLTRFYAHESCAQCTQCREGTAWTTRSSSASWRARARTEDLDTLLDIAENMTGKTICVLSDSCAAPVISASRSSGTSSRRSSRRSGDRRGGGGLT
jgi:hypothetical protein